MSVSPLEVISNSVLNHHFGSTIYTGQQHQNDTDDMRGASSQGGRLALIRIPCRQGKVSSDDGQPLVMAGNPHIGLIPCLRSHPMRVEMQTVALQCSEAANVRVHAVECTGRNFYLSQQIHGRYQVNGCSSNSNDVFGLRAVPNEAQFSLGGSRINRRATYPHVANAGGNGALVFDAKGKGTGASSTLAVLTAFGSSVPVLANLTGHDAIWIA